MHIDIVPNRKSRPAVLLRETYREGKKVKKRTLANLSKLSMEQVEAIRQVLKGEHLVPADQLFEVESSQHHGHVEAVRLAMKRLGLSRILGHRRSRERDLIEAAVAARILFPASKLAMTREWTQTTLAVELGVEDATVDEVYAAMDWLLERQDRIEKKLAKRHLEDGSVVLYDLSSSYFEGTTCPLAARGYSRDRKKGKLQVNYGLLTDDGGCPVAVTVFEGNTGDASTFMPQVDLVKHTFGLEHVVMVGDRGMITGKQVAEMREMDGIDWIAALRPDAIRKLVKGGAIQLGLFDERNLFELSHPDFPSERLIACRNPAMASRRARKRQELLNATCLVLDKISASVESGRLKGKDDIGVRVGRVINRYKVAKHFILQIYDDSFTYRLDEAKISAEAALDGLYVIRTRVDSDRLSADEAVRSYKRLGRVERAFRSLKTVDLLVRPIHHRLENRVRAHIFLCMLAYYVQWHMLEAWRPLLFSDEDTERKTKLDPVSPASRSPAALKKICARQLDDGTPVHSFQTLLSDLSTIVRNTCGASENSNTRARFQMDTRPSQLQQRALNLLNEIEV